MTLFERVRSIVNGRSAPPRPPCRLSEAEALEIARAALGSTSLFVEDVYQTVDGVEWRVGTATVGSGRTVRISDATGTTIDVTRWGIR